MLTDINEEGLPPQVQGLPETETADPFEGYVDYFGLDETHKYILPDGKQYIEFRAMNEGERAKYEAKTSRDIRFNRRTDDAAIKVDPSVDRHALIEACVTGWHIVRKLNGKWVPQPFSKGNPGSTLSQWLTVAPPKIVNDLISAIRLANPWMTDDMTVEQIDEEMAKLQEMRDKLVERDLAGKTS